MHKRGCGQAARLEDMWRGEESTILLVCHHVSSPGSPNPLQTEKPGTQESNLYFPQVYIPHTNAGWYCVNRNVHEWRTSLSGYTIISIHVPVFRSPKSACVPMQNLCGAGLCFTLDQNMGACSGWAASGPFLAAAKLCWAQYSPQAGNSNNM